MQGSASSTGFGSVTKHGVLNVIDPNMIYTISYILLPVSFILIIQIFSASLKMAQLPRCHTRHPFKAINCDWNHIVRLVDLSAILLVLYLSASKKMQICCMPSRPLRLPPRPGARLASLPCLVGHPSHHALRREPPLTRGRSIDGSMQAGIGTARGWPRLAIQPRTRVALSCKKISTQTSTSQAPA